MSDLPESWLQVPITEVLEPNNNGKPFQQGWSPQCLSTPAIDGRWGVLKTTAIQQGEFWPHENKALPDTLEPRPQIEVKPGDVLMTCAGPRNRCGVACLVERAQQKLMMSGKMYRFRPHLDAMRAKYLMYFLLTHASQLEIDRMKTGISDSGLNLTHDRFATLKVPLAPFSEQRRIVAKIEELFSELDKGVEALTTVREQLEAYRQSVLKHAFEGKLTEKWRKRTMSAEQSPCVLLDRLKDARDAYYAEQIRQWQADMREWEAKGEIGKRAPKPEKPTEVTPANAEDVASLPSLPKSWAYVRLATLAQIGSGMSVSKNRAVENPVEVPYLRVANVQRGAFDLTHVTKMKVEKSQLHQLELKKWDVLFNEGGDRDKLGRGWVWAGQIAPCITQNHVFRASPYMATELHAKFISYWGNAFGQGYFNTEGKQTTNLASINKTVLSAFPVPLPPMEEQYEIVREIETLLSDSDQIASDIEIQLAKSNALRQSILKKAFLGQLVAQNPKDEPASVLLERIRAERDGVAAKNSRNGKNGHKDRKKHTA